MTPKFDLSAFLPYRMAVLAEKLSAGLARQYRDEFGISIAEWRVLAHLADGGPVSVRDLEARVNLGKSRASRAASRLESAGYVTKEVDGTDRRLVALNLTGEGRALMARLLPVVTAYQARLETLLGDLSAPFDAACARLSDVP